MKSDEMDDREPHGDTRRRLTHRGVATLVVGTLAGAVLGVVAISWVRDGARVPAQRAEWQNAVTPAPWVAVSDVTLLRESLDAWIEATRHGDIPTQMRFYPAHVPVYYTWRNVPREAVHAEKVKVFGAARRLVITTDRPAVEIAEDGRSAVTRFRKQYVIEGPAVRRRGEVLQELRWTRTADGWVIVAERDARVLRSG